MKRLLPFCLVWFCTFGAYSQEFCWNAQTSPVQPIEAEAYLGFTSPIGGFYDTDPIIGGAGLGLELRYNLRELPLDFGVHLGLTTAVHEVWIPMYDDKGNWIDSHDDEQSNRTFNIMIVGDWNFRQGRRVNPFVGLGVGLSLHDVLMCEVYPDGKHDLSPGLMPRVGAELFRHLRFTLSSHISRKGYNNVQLSIGAVIGGRPRKR